MVIDLERCFGCRACMVACKVENNTPAAHFWMYVFRLEQGEYPDAEVTFLPRPCMHCDNAPCVKVCPVGARFKRADGLVATDYDRCIGWPPSAGPRPAGGHLKGVVEKCTFCVQRLESGLGTTACAAVCPVQAIVFGDLDDPKSAV